VSRFRSSLLIALIAQPFLFAQSFTFTKIVDEATLRPDGQGAFSNAISSSTDGRYVVWTDNRYSLWSTDLTTLQIVKLADSNTPVPGGSGNFIAFGQLAGGPYGNFNAVVRNGNVVFLGLDQVGTGVYSMAASGGPISRVVNYNTPLPNGATIGSAGFAIATIGLSDSGVVTFSGTATGSANASVYTANLDGSGLTLIADENHYFNNPLEPPGVNNSCVNDFGGGAVGVNTVVFYGQGGLRYWSIYAQPVTTSTQGVSPSACGTGPAGPVVLNAGKGLPGDPVTTNAQPDWDFLQTDGTNVYLHGSDFVVDCCSSLNGSWGGIFSAPLAGGTPTKIVENGDVLPVIGTVTDVAGEFSADAGGVVFIASNESASPTLTGIFLSSGGTIQKVLASGDMLDGAKISAGAGLQVWPQAYKNGVITLNAFGGVFAARLATTSTFSAAGGVATLAPGTIASTYGAGLATTTATAPTPPPTPAWPTSLAGTTVSIADAAGKVTAGQIFYASPAQVNYFIPDTVALGAATVTIIPSNGTSSSSPVNFVAAAPAVFTLDSANLAAAIAICVSASGGQSVENVYQASGGTVTAMPLNLGACSQTVLSLFLTGIDNVAASAVQVTIAGQPVTPAYAGPQGTYPGFDQINFTIPSSLAGAGSVPIVVTAGSQAANTVYVTIQ
jgi:uncharacterized protein (TIGR03437 family)